jgi:Pregnancy-associated plasma protein-A
MKSNKILAATATVVLLMTFGCNKDSLFNKSKVTISEELQTAETLYQGKRTCSSAKQNELLMTRDASFRESQQQIEEFTTRYITESKHLENRGVITIPVVVHVVYKTDAENISDAMIQSQIDVLNADFNESNADRINVPKAFKGRVGDFDINFCLAKRTPNNTSTNGIERRFTTRDYWEDDDVKFYATGGLDSWDASKYLNIWVCNLGGFLGYAYYPGAPKEIDGIVCLYGAFGYNSPFVPYHLGRTATHEVGHWLNLRHVWGDDDCGNDLVGDTPTQETYNFGCPTFPHKTCGNTSTGDMFMNFMDYVDDPCMIMFSNGQKGRAQATIRVARRELLSSLGCTPL